MDIQESSLTLLSTDCHHGVHRPQHDRFQRRLQHDPSRNWHHGRLVLERVDCIPAWEEEEWLVFVLRTYKLLFERAFCHEVSVC